jgi:phage repressor protein C with HTH and peptisase S24 domain/DNA-binding XRE family transcriptional regulator
MKADKKLRHLRAEKGWTKSEAARVAGIPFSSYRNYEKENLKELPGKTALSLSRAFGVKVEYLLDDSKDFPPGLEDRTDKEGQAVNIGVASQGRADKVKAAQYIGVSESYTTGLQLPNIPVVGYVAAGETDIAYTDAGLPVGGSIDEPLERLPDVVDEHAYGLVLSGNSMLPGYPRGTKVIVCPSEKVKSGDLVICRLRSTGKVYIKEIAFTPSGVVVLKSHNVTAYEPIVASREDIMFCHKVVWARRP